MTNIAILEDNPEVQEYLCELIDATEGFHCAAQYFSAEEAIEALPHRTDIDLLIVDINFGPGRKTGIDVLRALKPIYDERFASTPDSARPVPFMMYTVLEDPEKIFASLRAGANGYILKTDKSRSIIEALRDLSEGRSPISSSIASYVIRFFQKLPAPPIEEANLTKGEERVLALLAEGLLYKEIADRLAIKENTVKVHVHHIYEKMHVQNRTEATRIFLLKQQHWATSGSNSV